MPCYIDDNKSLRKFTKGVQLYENVMEYHSQFHEASSTHSLNISSKEYDFRKKKGSEEIILYKFFIIKIDNKNYKLENENIATDINGMSKGFFSITSASPELTYDHFLSASPCREYNVESSSAVSMLNPNLSRVSGANMCEIKENKREIFKITNFLLEYKQNINSNLDRINDDVTFIEQKKRKLFEYKVSLYSGKFECDIDESAERYLHPIIIRASEETGRGIKDKKIILRLPGGVGITY